MHRILLCCAAAMASICPRLNDNGADKIISLFMKQLATLNKLYSPPGSAFDFFTLHFCLPVLFFLGFV
jgi:hypothetical protein